MDANTETLIDCSPYFCILKDGSIDRMVGAEFVPAGHDPTTGVTSKDVTIDPKTNLSARIFLPPNPSKSKLPILIYFHGGAFLLESPFSPGCHKYINDLVPSCHVIAVSVDYRLAPEFPLPTAYNDSLDAVKWVFKCEDEWLAEHGNYEKVFLAGDSAGGNIAHYLAMHNTGIKIDGVILFHPWFGGSELVSNNELHTKTKQLTDKLWKYACPETGGVDDPRINPTAKDAPSLNGLTCKRLMVCVAEKDDFIEWQKAYYDAVKKSGWRGKVDFYETKGEEHCFHVLRPGCEKAKELRDLVVSFFAN
ncbi:hypothetical protein LUZ60_002713 [Juncus effusus]|nr:hypothetical protein LUZ60_002713 [Juncus effusus]